MGDDNVDEVDDIVDDDDNDGGDDYNYGVNDDDDDNSDDSTLASDDVGYLLPRSPQAHDWYTPLRGHPSRASYSARLHDSRLRLA